MEEIVLVENEWRRRTLGQTPEGVAFLGLRVQWVDVQELLDVMVVEFLEAHASVFDTVHEVFGFLAQHLETFFESNLILLRNGVDFGALLKDFDCALWHLSEHFAELVSCPLDAVQGFFGEHLKSAVRDFCVVFRISLGTVALCLVWKDYLHMTLGS